MAGSKVTPHVIGLLGGTGAGKSTAAGILSAEGIPVIDADEVSRDLTEPGGKAAAEIQRVFGDAYFGENGCLDRRALGQKVFSDPDALAQLEEILHPIMADEIRRRLEALEAETAVLDCAVLQKPLFRVLVDEIWTVAAPEGIRQVRIEKRDHLDTPAAAARIHAQTSPESMEADDDRIIMNEGSLDALKRELLEALTR